MESLRIKKRYGLHEDVRDACYEDNEKSGDFASLDNIIPSKENFNWSFTSTTNTPHIDIDLD